MDVDMLEQSLERAEQECDAVFLAIEDLIKEMRSAERSPTEEENADFLRRFTDLVKQIGLAGDRLLREYRVLRNEGQRPAGDS